jgi:hypothetical protein
MTESSGEVRRLVEETMPMLRRMTYLGLAAGLLLAAATAWAQQKIDARVVDYNGLADVVNKNRGKVVYVEFWDTG